MSGRVLDPSAVVDAATGASIYGRAIVDVALQHGIDLAIPAAALLEAWAHAPAEARPFLDLLLDLPVVIVDELDALSAENAGALAADRGSAGQPWLLGQAHAVQVSRDRGGWPVITGDADRLLALDPHIPFESLP